MSNISKEIPLKTRLKVLNEMCFIDLLSELGFREDKMWTDDEDELLGKLCKHALKHTEDILDELKNYDINEG